MYRLVAIDLDGTLLNAEGRVSPRTAEALKAASAAGITLAPATARWYQAAIRPFTQLGLEVAAIASAGADVRDKGGRSLASHGFDAETAAFVIGLCDRASWTATLSTLGLAYRRANDLPAWAANAPEWLRPVTSLAGLEIEPLLSVLAEVREDDQFMAELDSWADRISVFSALTFNGEALTTLTAPGVDKGSGLLALCEALGIDPADAVAIGDSEVDVPMFRVAGLAVAMGDGTDQAKLAAHQLTGSVADDGVAQFLESLL